MITKHEFQSGMGDITSLVMDSNEFYELCDEIEVKFDRMPKTEVDKLREAGHIPLVKRGTATQFIFDKYAVGTDLLSAIIRGNGMAVYAKAFSQGQA
jgi:hypothetical protein